MASNTKRIKKGYKWIFKSFCLFSILTAASAQNVSPSLVPDDYFPILPGASYYYNYYYQFGGRTGGGSTDRNFVRKFLDSSSSGDVKIYRFQDSIYYQMRESGSDTTYLTGYELDTTVVSFISAHPGLKVSKIQSIFNHTNNHIRFKKDYPAPADMGAFAPNCQYSLNAEFLNCFQTCDTGVGTQCRAGLRYGSRYIQNIGPVLYWSAITGVGSGKSTTTSLIKFVNIEDTIQINSFTYESVSINKKTHNQPVVETRVLNGKVNLSIPNLYPQNLKLKIYNITGNLIYGKKIGDNKTQITLRQNPISMKSLNLSPIDIKQNKCYIS